MATFIPLYIISGMTIFIFFILFLVISKSINGLINQFFKVEYLVKREFEYRQEMFEIKQMLDED